VSVACEGGEEKRHDDAPAGGDAWCERGKVEEVEEGEARDTGADEERHEHAEHEVVEALQAHDLRHDQPRVPHHRSIEHLRPPSSGGAAAAVEKEIWGGRRRARRSGGGWVRDLPRCGSWGDLGSGSAHGWFD
jgi:hypothetical protein